MIAINLVSVIIVSYNSGPLLIECISAVLDSTVPVEVIVSDNGSVDYSLGAVESMGQADPRVQVIHNKANLGFAVANNLAIGHGKGRYVLFLNPDCLVAPDTLYKVIIALDSNPEAAMAGCFISNPDGSEQKGCRRLMPTPKLLLATALGLEKLFSGNSFAGNTGVSFESLQQVHQVEAISGAFMLVRRDALQSVGSFDDGYFMHWEDLDLCARFRCAGHKLLFVPGAKVVHFKGRSSHRTPIRVEWHKHAGMIRFLRKFHFSRIPLPLYALITIPIWLRFALKVVFLNRVIGAMPPLIPQERNSKFDGEIWVFGATSAIGHCLLPRLLAEGYQVRAFSRDPSAHLAYHGHRLTWESADISVGMLPTLSGYPRVVVHLAPLDLLPPQLDYLINAGMQRLISFGSTSIFTKQNGTASERQLMERLCKAEHDIESLCSLHKVRWSILRPTIIYCPGLDRSISLLVRFIRHMRFFPIVGNAAGLRQPVHADDLAKACLSLLSSDRGWNQSYNLSGAETLSYRSMLTRIFLRHGQHPRIIKVPEWIFCTALVLARVLPAYRHLTIEMTRRTDINMVFDHSSAREAFGYDPRPFVP